MKVDITRSDLIRILRNSIELAGEANFLFENGYKRRAGFLALVSIEELLKVAIFEQSGNANGLSDHRKKFRFINEAMENTFKDILATNFTDLMGEGIEKFSPEKSKVVNECWQEAMMDLSSTLRFDRLRQYFLYEDFIPSKDAIHYKEAIETSLAQFVLHMANKLLSTISED